MKWLCCVIACLMLMGIMASHAADVAAKPKTKPSIKFTFVPKKGSFADLKGIVGEVEANSHRVAVYIKVDGGWWIKPYWDFPLTTLDKDGKWVCDITTGGIDEEATEIAAFLVKEGYKPPLAYGDEKIPGNIMKKAIAKVKVKR